MEFEVRRQLFHLIMGSIIVLLIYLDIFTFFTTLAFLLVGMVLCYISKFHKVPVVTWMVDYFERGEVRKKFPGQGSVLYFLGVLFSLFFFEKNVAMAALIILAVGDSVSPIVGKRYGRIKYTNTKMVEGIIAGAIASGLAASLFVPLQQAFIASFAAMLVEGLDLKLGLHKVDDNLIIPLIAGMVISLLR